MAVRTTMADLIALVRKMIYDPSSQSLFADQDYQDRLDASRDDVRYEGLAIAPSIVNTPSTNNQASTIFADYYSSYQWWEADVVIQGQGSTGAPWIVLTPTTSDYIVGHWTFEPNVFTAGTIPGQLPPLFATGKVYDPYAAAADILEFWAAMLASSYDVTADGQTLRRSQMMAAKLTLAAQYRRRAKPKRAKMTRSDVMAPTGARRMRLLDSDDVIRGAG